MSANGAVLCAGRLYCDLIFGGLPRLPSLGTEVYAETVRVAPGGGAFITAAHLRALGEAVRLASVLPGPHFGPVLAEALAEADLDMTMCATAEPGADPQITVALSRDSDRAFVTRRSGAAVPRFGSAALRGVRHLHIGELATLHDAPWLLDVARAVDATVSLDCSWDETLSTRVANLIARVDVFLPNAAEVAHLERLGLSAPFAPLTVVKNGASGATAYAETEIRHVAARKVPVVDTTGAGDAFNAGFLSRWLAGASLQQCLEAGHDRAATAIGYAGGFRRPENVPELVRQVGS